MLSSAAYALLFDSIGWRGLLLIGVLPALVIVYIRKYVKEPEVRIENRRKQRARVNPTISKKERRENASCQLQPLTRFRSHGGRNRPRIKSRPTGRSRQDCDPPVSSWLCCPFEYFLR
jgi:hypothetical protein